MKDMLAEDPLPIAVICGIFGLLVGSFLNVVIHRLPREGMRVSEGRSHCPQCAAQIAWYDNIPVLSWVVLCGRCRNCKAAISPRYPLVELTTGVLFFAIFVLHLERQGAEEFSWPFLATHLLVVSALLAASIIDFDFQILPDLITKPLMGFGVIASCLVPELQRGGSLIESVRPGWSWMHGLSEAVIGLLAGLVVIGGIRLLAEKLFRREAMGLGDVKLMGGLGALAGAKGVLYILLLGSLVGSLMGLVNVLRILVYRAFRMLGRKAPVRLWRWDVAWVAGRVIPFGPALSLAGVIVLLFRSELETFLFETWPDWIRGNPLPGGILE